MLGYSRDDLASGRIGWRELTPPEWEDVSIRAVAEIQATGRCEVFEKEYFRKDGTRVPILMASAAIDESPRQIVAFVLDLTARKQAEEALKRSETSLAEAQRLTHEREAAIVNERTRLAGEIHDTLAQALAMIVMQLADAEAKLGSEWSRAEKPLSMVRELAVESLAYARRSVNMLRPNVALAGSRGLFAMSSTVSPGTFGGSMDLTVNGDPALFDAAVESALTGIAREAITNAVKHSNATRIARGARFREGRRRARGRVGRRYRLRSQCRTHGLVWPGQHAGTRRSRSRRADIRHGAGRRHHDHRELVAGKRWARAE